MTNHKSNKLTELELEIMNEIWQLGLPTISDVHKTLLNKSNKKVAYTTVATMIKILEKKKFLLLKKIGNSHHYQPKISKEKYQTAAIGHLIEKVLDKSPSKLVMKLLDTNELNNVELEEIQKMINLRLGHE